MHFSDVVRVPRYPPPMSILSNEPKTAEPSVGLCGLRLLPLHVLPLHLLFPVEVPNSWVHVPLSFGMGLGAPHGRPDVFSIVLEGSDGR